MLSHHSPPKHSNHVTSKESRHRKLDSANPIVCKNTRAEEDRYRMKSTSSFYGASDVSALHKTAMAPMSNTPDIEAVLSKFPSIVVILSVGEVVSQVYPALRTGTSIRSGACLRMRNKFPSQTLSFSIRVQQRYFLVLFYAYREMFILHLTTTRKRQRHPCSLLARAQAREK